MSRPPIAIAIDTSAAAPRAWDAESLPGWLASMICHMIVVIVLGLAYSETPKAPTMTELELKGTTQYGDDLGGDNLEMGGSGLEENEPFDAQLPTDAPTESLAAADPVDLTTPMAADWASIVPAPSVEGAGQALSNLLSDSPSEGDAHGTGRGHGLGFGDGDGNGSGPGFGKTGMFGLVDEGMRFVYVFDRSESMNSVFTLTGGTRSVSVTPLQAAKLELIKSLESLNSSNEFQLIFYNDEPLLFEDAYAQDGVYKASVEGKRSAKSFIEQLPAEGNTNHLGALEAACELRPDVIFLLTDGEAKDDPWPRDVKRIVKMCRKSNTRINVIHFAHVARPGSTLEELATGTHGQHISISIRDLANAMW